MNGISATGSWQSTRLRGHRHDASLADALADFFRGRTVIDFGCGTGFYVRSINETADCRGYDGNPQTPKLADASCHILDLAFPVDVGTADWVLSLEVGEHIPREYEATFIDNLHRHNSVGIVLSWAQPGQGGIGHCNERSVEYVADQFATRNYMRDQPQEEAFRSAAQRRWFRRNILVLRRQDQLHSCRPDEEALADSTEREGSE